jgi:hypothetical protein
LITGSRPTIFEFFNRIARLQSFGEQYSGNWPFDLDKLKVATRVYFPTTAIVSLLYMLEDAGTSEIAVVGNDGILGIVQFMGGETTPSRAVVQSAGWGYRIDTRFIKSEFNRGAALTHLLLRYIQALITQMSRLLCATGTMESSSSCAAGYS